MQAISPKNGAAGRTGVHAFMVVRRHARVQAIGASMIRPYILPAKRRSRQRTQRLTFSGIARVATGIIVHVFHTFPIFLL